MIDYWLPSFFPVRITPECRLRHVLGHTAQGCPGRTFAYSGGRYGFIYGVIEKVGGMPLKERVIDCSFSPDHKGVNNVSLARDLSPSGASSDCSRARACSRAR